LIGSPPRISRGERSDLDSLGVSLPGEPWFEGRFVTTLALDRAATLRNAEKLLRQGKLELAMAEYTRIVEEFPRDWNSGNILGDLYIRAGRVDEAVQQFSRIAESLHDEGFHSKAGALYKKILKLKPDHEQALLQSAEIAGSQGLLVEARAHLNTLLERRRSRSDQRGVAQIRIRLAMLDPADYAARFAAARARIDVGDATGALVDFKNLAKELIENGRAGEAAEALREAAILSPGDPEIGERLVQAHVASGEFAKARQAATTSAQFKAIASELEAKGQADEALSTLREAARRDPADSALQEHLARAFVARGDMTAAAEYMSVESAGGNPQLLLTVAEIRLRTGRIDEGLDIARGILKDDPLRRQDVALVGWTVAEQAPEAGYKLVELAAETAVDQSDWPSAAAALQEFVTRVPNHVAALMRLVEICVDGGLEATLYSAQAQLADAYILAGSATEARFIAEDLVAREPWERANIERFRRALVLLGEADPDLVIADRLSGQSPFTSTDISLKGDELPAFDAVAASPSAADAGAKLDPGAAAPAAADEPPTPVAEPPTSVAEPPTSVAEPPASVAEPALPAAPAQNPPAAEAAPVEIDLQRLVGTSTAHGRKESVEVDLSIVVDEVRKPLPAPPRPAPPQPKRASTKAIPDLDGVFAQLREEVTRRSTQSADDEFKRGLELLQAGKVDEAVPVLKASSKVPRLRFGAASALGRSFRDRGMTAEAVEWLERAAEAPPPTPEDGHQLLYDLAEALEASGDVARALAICIELQAEAGSYRDVAARVHHLAKAQARG
jgi:tetratricopeptide (TPR) repeat protein